MFLTKNRLLKILLALLTVLVAVLAVKVAQRHFADKAAEAGDPAKPSASAVSPTTSIQLTAPEAAFSALTYSNGTTTLAFSQDKDSIWYWDGDREFPLDTACIEAILSEVAVLEPSTVITDGESLETYGLDEQSIYLTARNADGTRLHLDFGKTAPNGTARYALMDDDPDTVYVLETDLLSLMDTPIYDMMRLPELPQIKGNEISSIIVRGGQETAIAVSAENGAAPVWQVNGDPVTDRSLLQELLDELSALTLTRCENFKPSDAALTAFGLDDPTAMVSIFYGTDKSLFLTVGSKTLSGGAYYVMLQNDTTIYSMESAALDTVLVVAACGLTEDQKEIPAEPLPMGDEPSAL